MQRSKSTNMPLAGQASQQICPWFVCVLRWLVKSQDAWSFFRCKCLSKRWSFPLIQCPCPTGGAGWWLWHWEDQNMSCFTGIIWIIYGSQIWSLSKICSIVTPDVRRSQTLYECSHAVLLVGDHNKYRSFHRCTTPQRTYSTVQWCLNFNYFNEVHNKKYDIKHEHKTLENPIPSISLLKCVF